MGEKFRMTKYDAEQVIKRSDNIHMLPFPALPDDPRFCQMMSQCFTKEPERRPSFKELSRTLKQLTLEFL